MDKLRRIALFSVELVGSIIFFIGIWLMISSFGFGTFFMPLGNVLFSGFSGLVSAFIGISIADGAKNLEIFKKKEVKK